MKATFIKNFRRTYLNQRNMRRHLSAISCQLLAIPKSMILSSEQSVICNWSFWNETSSFRVHALACCRDREARRGGQTKVWTLNEERKFNHQNYSWSYDLSRKTGSEARRFLTHKCVTLTIYSIHNRSNDWWFRIKTGTFCGYLSAFTIAFGEVENLSITLSLKMPK